MDNVEKTETDLEALDKKKHQHEAFAAVGGC